MKTYKLVELIGNTPLVEPPNFNNPIENRITNKAIILDIQQVWICDKETGKIYYKLK